MWQIQVPFLMTTTARVGKYILICIHREVAQSGPYGAPSQYMPSQRSGGWSAFALIRYIPARRLWRLSSFRSSRWRPRQPTEPGSYSGPVLGATRNIGQPIKGPLRALGRLEARHPYIALVECIGICVSSSSLPLSLVGFISTIKICSRSTSHGTDALLRRRS